MKRKSHIGGGVARGLVTLVALLMSLVVLASCQEPNAELPQASISVRVADATGARTITPEGNVNISHYVITVVNEAESIEQSSGYLTKGSMFTVSNVPAGTWYAKVDAYIQREADTYIKVASDQSEPKAVAAGSSTVFDLVLDTLDATVSGDVTVTLRMPTILATQDTPFWYTYTIAGMTNEEFAYTSPLAQSTTGTDGLATITLDADSIGLMQGAYRFEITVQDAESNPTLTRKGVDVMRLINSLEAKGTIDLATYESDQSFDVTITDKIGDILTPSIQDGKPLYELDAETGNTLTVTLTEPLKTNETIEWYVDGELDETVNTDNATTGQYTLTFTNGSHSITAIIRDTDTQMAVGSVSFMVDNMNVEFAERRTRVGDTVIVNDVEVLVVAAKGEDGSWISTAGAQGVEYIGVDKNHDLSFYVKGDDYVDSDNFDQSPGTFGYEWGGFRTGEYGTETEIQDTAVGTGLNNTNALIEKNLQPGTEGWWVVWAKVEEFRQSHSDKWFVPSKDELNLVYQQKDNLSNLSTSLNYYYWSSSENSVSALSARSVWAQHFTSGKQYSEVKNVHNVRTRLCVQFTEDDIGSAAIGGGDETEESIFTFELNDDQQSYTLTGLTQGIGEFVMPESGVLEIPATYQGKPVTKIGDTAFYDRTDIEGSIVIPDSVTEIGYRAFKYCSALTGINIPDSVIEIGQSAFDNCSALKKVEISDSSQLTSIGNSAFGVCYSLININIPDSVTEIESYAFTGCSSLTSINIPDSVTKIGNVGFSPFNNCTSLANIYCEISPQPEGWAFGWLGNCSADVFWGVSRSEYDAIMNNDSVPYEVSKPVISVDTDNATITCDKTFAHIYYTTDGTEPDKDNGTLYTEAFTVEVGQTIKAIAYVGNGIYSEVAEFVTSNPERTISVGDTVTVDGIEALVIAAKNNSGSWESTEGSEGTEYIGVDKNHDLSFYISGNDFYNITESIDVINSSANYGYDWNGYGTESEIQDTALGTGKANTESLILKYMVATPDWRYLWTTVQEFQIDYSDKWFVPSTDELRLIFQNKDRLTNLTTDYTANACYWSSSEEDSEMAQCLEFGSGGLHEGQASNHLKNSHNNRVRLCVQFTIEDVQ